MRRALRSWALGTLGVTLAFAACGDVSETDDGRDAGEAGQAGSAGTAGAAGHGGATSTGGVGPDPGGSAGEPDSGAGPGPGGAGGADGGSGGQGSTPECGDGTTELGEACDDGNGNASDGCHRCTVEPGFRCDTSAPSVCKPRIAAIAGGLLHTCAVLGSGNVLCWGSNTYSQTGYPNSRDIGDNEVPASMGFVDVGAEVREVAAAPYATCALLVSGAVRCWGYGDTGQLGYGNTESVGYDTPPREAGDVDVGGPVRQIVMGEAHACALLSDGAVRCWGETYGPERTETIGDDETPASAGEVTVGGSVQALAAGSWHTCALLSTGAVRCWGLAEHGQLGYGNTEFIGDDETPADAGDVPVGGIVMQIAAGGSRTCAGLADGAVRCWGDNQDSALGYGNIENVGDDETPASLGDVPLGVRAAHVACGARHTCVLTTEGGVRCWGAQYFGQTGYGHTESVGDLELPSSRDDVDVGGHVELLTAGGDHNCVVLTRSGALRCWGRGEEGQLGYGNENNIGDDEIPASAGDVDYF